MDHIRDEFNEYLKANFTIRRIIALALGFGCIGVCVAVVIGNYHLEIWQTVLVLILGLMFFEWAG